MPKLAAGLGPNAPVSATLHSALEDTEKWIGGYIEGHTPRSQGFPPTVTVHQIKQICPIPGVGQPGTFQIHTNWGVIAHEAGLSTSSWEHTTPDTIVPHPSTTDVSLFPDGRVLLEIYDYLGTGRDKSRHFKVLYPKNHPGTPTYFDDLPSWAHEPPQD